MQVAKTFISRAMVISILLVVIIGSVYGVGASFNQPAAVQDVLGLERRISLIEQRFYAMESRLNRLEQQATASPRTPPAAASPRDSEINFLTNEIGLLRRRLAEAECGVIRLDERTRPSDRDKAPSDPCRANPNEPVKLSVRP